jgi:hypothetical protein
MFVSLRRYPLLYNQRCRECSQNTAAEACRILKSLRGKGIVTATVKHSTQFSALPFEKVLDLFKRAKLKEAMRTEQNRKGILSIWQSMVRGDSAS